MECKHCNKKFDDNKKFYHHERKCKGIRICTICNFHIKTSFDKHVNSCKGLGPRKSRPKHAGGHAWKKGKTYVEVYGEERTKAIKAKQLDKLKLRPTQYHTQETKDKISKSMLNNTNWINSTDKSGKSKTGRYLGIFFNSSWELAYIVYCNEHNIKIQRNKQYFDYIDKFGKSRKYVPDFILEDGTYLEIKGYYTENVGQKLKYFPHPITVYYENDMKMYLDYVINKYGKNFIEVLQDIKIQKIPRLNKYDACKKLHEATIERHKTLYLDIIKNANIDYTKFGWVSELTNLLNVSHTQIRRIIKNILPELLDTAFMRKGRINI